MQTLTGASDLFAWFLTTTVGDYIASKRWA